MASIPTMSTRRPTQSVSESGQAVDFGTTTSTPGPSDPTSGSEDLGQTHRPPPVVGSWSGWPLVGARAAPPGREIGVPTLATQSAKHAGRVPIVSVGTGNQGPQAGSHGQD